MLGCQNATQPTGYWLNKLVVIAWMQRRNPDFNGQIFFTVSKGVGSNED